MPLPPGSRKSRPGLASGGPRGPTQRAPVSIATQPRPDGSAPGSSGARSAVGPARLPTRSALMWIPAEQKLTKKMTVDRYPSGPGPTRERWLAKAAWRPYDRRPNRVHFGVRKLASAIFLTDATGRWTRRLIDLGRPFLNRRPVPALPNPVALNPGRSNATRDMSCDA